MWWQRSSKFTNWITTNFGFGVLPLICTWSTCWGLPKPVLTGRNARSVKSFNNFSYRQQFLRTNDIDINFVKGITNCIKYCLHCSLLLLLKILFNIFEEYIMFVGIKYLFTISCYGQSQLFFTEHNILCFY